MSRPITTQSTNKINIYGKVLDITFGEGTLSTGSQYERATLTIRVEQTYDGRTDISEIPVGVFATPHTRGGAANPVWDTMQSIKTLKTAQNVGLENADSIRIKGGQLRENNFVAKNSGQLITGWQLSTSFITKGAGQNPVKDIASFQFDLFILDMHDELDRDDDTTGRLVVKGGIVKYDGSLDVVEFIVEDPAKIDFISRNWEVNQTVNAEGRIRVTSQVENVAGKHSSWGEELPNETTRTVKELIITSGSDEGYEEEFAYDPDDIRKAFNIRKAMIEQMQLQARTNANKPAAAATAKTSNVKTYEWE